MNAYRRFGLNICHRPLVLRTEVQGPLLVQRGPVALFSTKRHVNAVTEQMVGTMRSWSDADGLVVGLGDAECIAAREAYLRGQKR